MSGYASNKGLLAGDNGFAGNTPIIPSNGPSSSQLAHFQKNTANPGSQDAIFEMLTFKQWETTIRSKVQSTENLHTVLPSGLDFFIMLSSLAGVVGTVSQANYAAGNTFQDAFARYRRSIGQRATAVDLGRMGEVGVIAENAQYSRHQENVPVMEDISEKEFHSILEQCCQPPNAPQTDGLAESDQVLVGLVSPAQLRAQHVDVPVWMTERALFRALPQDPTDQFDATLATTDPTAAVATSAGHWHAIFMKTDPGDAPSVVISGLTQKLGHALDVPAGDIDTQRSLALQGVDSLLAVELRQWISRAFQSNVSALDISSSPSLEDLAGLVVGKSEAIKTDE